MDRQTTCWLAALCLGLTLWLYWDVNSMAISYDWHYWLVDDKSGEKIKPSELIELGKVINRTQEYINRTNAIERLYDLEYNLNAENPFPRDEIYSSREQLAQSGWPVANQTKCGTQLDWINGKLSDNIDYALARGQLGLELTQLMDSFGRSEAGGLTGSLVWPGLYGQCLKTTLDSGTIRTRYCWARLRPKWWPSEERVHPKSRIKIGVCLPETCDTNSFERHRAKIETLVKWELLDFYKENLVFESLFCLPDERSPIRQLPPASKLFLWLLGTWLGVVIFASILYGIEESRKQSHALELREASQLQIVKTLRKQSYGPQRSTERTWVRLMAIQRTLEEFVSDPIRRRIRQAREKGEEVRLDLACIDFLKIIMALLVVLGHGLLFNLAFTRSRSMRVELEMSDAVLTSLGLSRTNDVFFLLFGVLSTYTLLRKMSDKQLGNPLLWLDNVWSKFIRVAPLFMLIYWYVKLLSVYTGSGPWWDYAVFRDSVRGFCANEPWYKSIPYFGMVGVPPIAPCIFPGWFIVVYVKLSLLMPLFACLIYRLPSHAKRQLFIAFTFLVSSLQIIVKMNKQTSFKIEAFSNYGAFILDLAEKFESTGIMATIGKLGYVALGCYVGYLLRMYEIGQITSWPKWCTSKVTLALTFALQLLIVCLPVLARTLAGGRATTLVEFLSGYLMATLVWSLALAIQIISISTVHNQSGLARFIGHSFWHIFNKLSFGIFLIHWEVLWYSVNGNEQAPVMGRFTDVLTAWAVGAFYTIPIAFLVHVLFEAPMTKVLVHATNKTIGRLGKIKS